MDLAGRQMWGGTVSITVNSTAETDLVKDQKTAFIFNCHNSLDNGCLTCRVFLFFYYFSSPFSLTLNQCPHTVPLFSCVPMLLCGMSFKKKSCFLQRCCWMCVQIWWRSVLCFLRMQSEEGVEKYQQFSISIFLTFLYRRWTCVRTAHFESAVCFTEVLFVVHWNISDQTLRESV